MLTRIMGKRDKLAVVFCLAALLYVFTGSGSRAQPKTLAPVTLAPVDSNESAVSGEAFAPDAVSNLGRPGYLSRPLLFYGSFQNGGDTLGSTQTTVYKAVPDF